MTETTPDASAGHSVKVAEPTDGTEYVVLKQGTEGDWKLAGKSSARSADAAIRDVVGRSPEAERKGKFVAIPSRSFKPVTVSEKVERTVVIGGGS